MSLGHKAFYKNTAWQYGLQAVKYIFPLITLPYLTRVLEPEGYAVYAYVVSFMTFAQVVVDFGFNLSGTKKIVAAENVDDENRAIGAVTQARLLLSAIAGVAVSIIALCIPITRANLLYTMLAFVAVAGKAMAPDFVFQGHEQMGPLTTRYFVSKGLSTALTFVFVHSIADILWVPTLDIVSSVIALVWSFLAAKRMFGTTIARVPASDMFAELRTSALYCLSNIASTAFSGFTTLLIGIVITDAVQISYWSLAMTAVGAVQALYAPITNSLYPHMVAGRDFGFARKLAFISIPFIIGGTVLFFAISDWIVLVLGGQDYLPGVYVMRMVSPVLVFSFYGMFFGWPVLGAAGRVKELTRSTVIAGVFSVVALLGVTAVGAASIAAFAVVRSLTEALMCGLRLFECWRAFKKGGPQDGKAADGGIQA